jgi:hypothetical protein
MEKPLTSRYKGLLSASYKTPLEIWQFDATLQLNGGGRLPLEETPTFRSFPQLNAQITRWFRKFSIYVGGENLTGFRQKQTIIGADSPWSSSFEPTMVWGPTNQIGLRVTEGHMKTAVVRLAIMGINPGIKFLIRATH